MLGSFRLARIFFLKRWLFFEADLLLFFVGWRRRFGGIAVSIKSVPVDDATNDELGERAESNFRLMLVDFEQDISDVLVDVA